MLPLLWNRDQDTAFPQIPSNNPALARVASIGAVGYSLWKSAHIQVARHGFKCFALRLPVDLHVFFPEMCWGYWELFKWVREWETQAEEGLFHPRAPASCLYLFQPPPLLLLLLNALLPFCQQLPLVLLLLAELLLLQQLLPPKGLGPFLVFLLQSQEITSEGWFSRHIDNGTATRGSESLPDNEAWWAIKDLFQSRGTLIKYSTMLNFHLVSFGAKALDACRIHALSGRREMRPSKIRTDSDIMEPRPIIFAINLPPSRARWL